MNPRCHFDPQNLTIHVQFNHLNDLKVTKKEVRISHFSGKKGGQNVNRHLNGVRLHYMIPETHRLAHKKTQTLTAKCVQQKSLDQNLQLAFSKLAQKISKYFYTPPKRKNTKVPKSSKEKRLKNKKYLQQKKQNRQKVDY